MRRDGSGGGGAAIVQQAQYYLGTSYGDLDCSGLVRQVYKDIYGDTVISGKNSTEMYNYFNNKGLVKSGTNAQSGDILFFHKHSLGYVKHVGIATGNGLEMIHSSSSQYKVVTDDNYNWDGSTWKYVGYVSVSTVVGGATPGDPSCTDGSCTGAQYGSEICGTGACGEVTCESSNCGSEGREVCVNSGIVDVYKEKRANMSYHRDEEYWDISIGETKARLDEEKFKASVGYNTTITATKESIEANHHDNSIIYLDNKEVNVRHLHSRIKLTEDQAVMSFEGDAVVRAVKGEVEINYHDTDFVRVNHTGVTIQCEGARIRVSGGVIYLDGYVEVNGNMHVDGYVRASEFIGPGL